MTTIPATATVKVRQSREWALAERVIADYINNLDDVDAIRFTDTSSGIHFTAYVYSEGEYEQASYVPHYYDTDDFSSDVAPIVAFALNDLCQAYEMTDGIIAVNTDNDKELLLTRTSS